MNGYGRDNVFRRSGLAALSDLESPVPRQLFSLLEQEQDAFLKRQSGFLRPDYPWPRDPLHTWSRVWEYPYTYYHLKRLAETLTPRDNLAVVDLGSAVTFFPFVVAKLGYRVHCLDIDAACGPDLDRAASAIVHAPGSIDFGLISEGGVPLGDETVDAVYCVSVLEHIPEFEKTIDEVFRVLKPGGHFILTIDLDRCGYRPIGPATYYRLRQALNRRFAMEEPELTIHPLDALSFRTGPFPAATFTAWQERVFHLKQRARKLLGKRHHKMLPDLVCWGAVLTKRDSAHA